MLHVFLWAKRRVLGKIKHVALPLVFGALEPCFEGISVSQEESFLLCSAACRTLCPLCSSLFQSGCSSDAVVYQTACVPVGCGAECDRMAGCEESGKHKSYP